MKLDHKKADAQRRRLFNYIDSIELKCVDTRLNLAGCAKNKDGTTSVTLWATDTISAAIHVHLSKPRAKIGILNFASYKEPGGDFMYDEDGQEESLCYCTNLYTELTKFRGWYSHPINGELYSNENILCTNIAVLASGRNKYLNERDIFYVDILSGSAPNMEYISKNSPELIDVCNEKMEERVKYLVNVMASRKYDVLILGAFGCGKLGNNPEIVSKAFLEALEENCGNIKRVVFAIPEEDSANYSAFKRTFTKRNKALWGANIND